MRLAGGTPPAQTARTSVAATPMNVNLPACIAGDKDAWDDFVRAAAPIIYAAVRRSMRHRGGASQEINDRVQDVYVRLLREDCRLLRTFDPKRASLPTWLTLISRTVVHEQMRKHKQHTVSLNGFERAPGSEGVRESGKGAADVRLPISMLSPLQKRVLELLFDHGLSVEQAAARLQVEAQTVRSAKHKALTRLREHLGMDSGTSTGTGKDRRNAGISGTSDLYNKED